MTKFSDPIKERGGNCASCVHYSKRERYCTVKDIDVPSNFHCGQWRHWNYERAAL